MMSTLKQMTVANCGGPFLAKLLVLATCLMSPVVLAQGKQTAAPIPVNPGWGNAAKVCGKPRLGNDSRRLAAKGARNSFPTGFYRIQKLSLDNPPAYLDAALDQSVLKPVVREIPANTARRWLLTQVGSDLYQISTCVEGIAHCLLPAPGPGTDSTRGIILGTCDFEGLGTQAWWMHGLIVGPTAGGYRLGSDGFGRLACLDTTKSGSTTLVPRLSGCSDDQRLGAWRIEKHRPHSK